jgi:hypothetical protein
VATSRVEAALRRADALPRLADFPRQDRVPHPWPVESSRAYGGKVSREQALEAPVEDVPLDRLLGVQRGVDRQKLRGYIEHGGDAPQGKESDSGYPRDLPIVVRTGGELYVHDGHHRLTAHALLGDKTAKARVVDINRPALGQWADHEDD